MSRIVSSLPAGRTGPASPATPPTDERFERTPDPAVAPPPGHARFPLFDSLRAIAALSVLVFHAAQVADTESGRETDTWWEALAARLPLGVTIFFLISGFLLYRPFVAARFRSAPAPAFRDFARRRVLRIVPAFWVALLLLYPLGLVWFPGGLFPDGLLIFGFLQTWSNATFAGGLGVSWSLSVEASFYLLLPLYAAVAARVLVHRDRSSAVRVELAALAALSAASLVFTTVAYDRGAFALAETVLGNFLWFALGMGLAVVSAAGVQVRSAAWARLTESSGAAWSAALVVLLLSASVAGLPELGEGVPTDHTTQGWVLQKLLFGLIAFLLLLPAVFATERGGLPRRILASPSLMWLGLISYGLYLWHTPVIGWYRDNGPDLAGEPAGLAMLHLLAVGLAATLAFATASYYLVERPILRFKDGLPVPSWLRRSGDSRRFEIGGGLAGPRRARALVTDAYHGRLPAERMDALRLLITELVTNSVVHGGVGEDGQITLTIAMNDDRIRVDLVDSGRQGRPELHPPDLRRGRGFGLFLVNRLATSWGTAHDPRLRVWFEIAWPRPVGNP